MDVLEFVRILADGNHAYAALMMREVDLSSPEKRLALADSLTRILELSERGETAPLVVSDEQLESFTMWTHAISVMGAVVAWDVMSRCPIRELWGHMDKFHLNPQAPSVDGRLQLKPSDGVFIVREVGGRTYFSALDNIELSRVGEDITLAPIGRRRVRLRDLRPRLTPKASAMIDGRGGVCVCPDLRHNSMGISIAPSGAVRRLRFTAQ